MSQQDIIDALNETPDLKQQVLSHFMQAQAEILVQKEQEPNPIALGNRYAPKIVSNIKFHLDQNPHLDREDLIKAAVLPILYTLACMDVCEEELLARGVDLDYCRSYFKTLVEGVDRELKI